MSSKKRSGVAMKGSFVVKLKSAFCIATVLLVPVPAGRYRSAGTTVITKLQPPAAGGSTYSQTVATLDPGYPFNIM